MVNFITNPEKKDWPQLLSRPTKSLAEIEAKVAPILANVKANGDTALRQYALEFDNIFLHDLAINKAEIDESENQISIELKAAIEQAYANIKTFHESQKAEIIPVETMPGVVCWRKSSAIQKVGLYIPGGTAPLFSTVLMLGVPAQIAGCKEVVLCTPSNNPAIYFAAKLCGISKIFRIGGAQAVAAMAYGTISVPKVYKIFGPGNQFVTAAKMLVNKEGTAIDMPAGPSEVAVLADSTAVPAFVASDLLSQAEHGIDSQVLLVSTSLTILEQVKAELTLQTVLLPRKEMVLKTLENSRFVFFEKENEAIEFINEYAAEHLILATENPENWEPQIHTAGSIFMGNYTPESAGDYASGTNHTLPTNGYATAYSGVSLDSFVKKITVQQISKEGLKNVGPIVEIMAENEQLQAHKNAVTLRLATIMQII